MAELGMRFKQVQVQVEIDNRRHCYPTVCQTHQAWPPPGSLSEASAGPRLRFNCWQKVTSYDYRHKVSRHSATVEQASIHNCCGRRPRLVSLSIRMRCQNKYPVTVTVTVTVWARQGHNWAWQYMPLSDTLNPPRIERIEHCISMATVL